MSDRATRRIPLSEPVVGETEKRYVAEALDSGWLSGAGRYVTEFERLIAARAGVPHAVACVNGTAGLHLSLLLSGVRAGDVVVVPTVTFVATVNAVRYLGAEPVFMDCDEHLNLDVAKLADYLERGCRPGAEGLDDAATGRPVRAIVPVHVFGNPCDMAAVLALASEHGLAVVEDASESLGAGWTAGPLAGRMTGGVSGFGVFSFNTNKIVTTGGGGMLVTADAEAAAHAKYLTTQAKDDPVRYVHGEVGYNYRLGNVQAAIGVAQMERLDGFIATKRRNHEVYREVLSGAPGLRLVDPPEGTEPNHWFYSLVVDPEVHGETRDDLMARLEGLGIQSRPLWKPNHLQRPYVSSPSWRIERAEWYWERVLNLPCGGALPAEDARFVAEAVRDTGMSA